MGSTENQIPRSGKYVNDRPDNNRRVVKAYNVRKTCENLKLAKIQYTKSDNYAKLVSAHLVNYSVLWGGG